MIASTSTLPRSTFFSDFGSETLRSDFRGRLESVRLLSATPPAIPASAAPPAIKGVFAFEASSATFPPALLTAPFELLGRALEVVERAREPDDLVELLRARVPERLLRALVLFARELLFDPLDEPFFDRLDEPFLLVDLLELERRGLERLLEDFVV